ncbi:IS5 family transposase, partial [Desulfocurvibacter africanus]|uniref:IS5 family transposase n=4 Tax=Desulfocurvibacter africanus TaxID=873 RepID=UPI0004842CCD
PQGRRLLTMLGGPPTDSCPLLMDGAYEGNETRTLSRDLGFVPVVPPNPNRLEPWEYDKELYKKRNEIERLFRRLKGYRRIFTRYDKLDVMYLGFLTLALIVEALR